MRLRPFREIARSAWLGATRKAARKDREAIRQWLLLELSETYSYPISWLKQRLQLINGDGPQRGPNGFFGFSLLTSKGEPFLVVSIEPGKAAPAETRLREYLRTDLFCRLGLSTDGTVEGTRILRQRSNSEECDFVPDLETFFLSEGQHFLGPFRAPGGKGHPGRELEPISDSLEDVFFQAHSHVRDID